MTNPTMPPFGYRMPSPPRSQTTFRVGMALLAAVLAGFSIWMLLPELARSAIRQLPADRETATAAAMARQQAYSAAMFGAVRGDLWSEAAYSYAIALWGGGESAGDAGVAGSASRPVVERAIAYAPHASGLWLLAASLASRFDWPNCDPASMLKVSYYTGQNEIALVAWRLVAATQSKLLADADIRGFAERDVRMILTRWSELKPSLIGIYRDADPAAKRFLDGVIATTDAAFAQALRSSSTRP
jgi:hypothetical protein